MMMLVNHKTERGGFFDALLTLVSFFWWSMALFGDSAVRFGLVSSVFVLVIVVLPCELVVAVISFVMLWCFWW